MGVDVQMNIHFVEAKPFGELKYKEICITF